MRFAMKYYVRYARPPKFPSSWLHVGRLHTNGIVRKSCKKPVNAKQVLKSAENSEYEFTNRYESSSFLLSNSCNALELKRYDWIRIDGKSSEKKIWKIQWGGLACLTKVEYLLRRNLLEHGERHSVP